MNLKHYISRILLIVGLGFILSLIVSYWPEVLNYILNCRPLYLIASLFTYLVCQLGVGCLFVSLVHAYRLGVSHRVALSWYNASLITKYIPGKVWSFLYQIAQVNRKGGAVAVIALNIELTLIALNFTASLALAMLLYQTHPLLAFLAITLGAIIASVLIKIPITRLIPRRLLNFIGGAGNERPDAIPMLALIAMWVGTILFSIAQVLMLLAFFDLSLPEAVSLVGMLLFAWIAGVLAIVVPAGLGVREGAFLLIASVENQYAGELLVSIVLLSRVWHIAADFSSSLLIGLCLKLWPPETKPLA